MSIHHEPEQNDDFETETIEQVFEAVIAGDLARAQGALRQLQTAGGHGIAERLQRCRRRAERAQPQLALRKRAA